jgi:hypothetical protein
MDVWTIFLHIFNKKFWLQFICNKLISTIAHESVKIISIAWLQSGELRIAEILQTDGRTDGDQVFEQRA